MNWSLKKKKKRTNVEEWNYEEAEKWKYSSKVEVPQNGV